MHANILFVSSDKNHLCMYSDDDFDFLRGLAAADYFDGPKPDAVENTIADNFGCSATYTEYDNQNDGILGEISFDDAKLEAWVAVKLEEFRARVAAIQTPADGKWENTLLAFDKALRNPVTDLWTCEPICFDYCYDTPVKFALKYLSEYRGKKLYVCDCLGYHC